MLLTGVIAGCALWALLATAAYFDGVALLASKQDEIAHRTAELDGVKANYKAAFGRLDEFQTIFSGITCEISDIQDSLLRITEKSVTTGKRGAAAMPRLNPDASGCRTIANTGVAASDGSNGVDIGDTRRIIGALKDNAAPKEVVSADQEVLRRRVAHLEEELTKLKASHGAFLEQTAGIAAVRIDELERALSAVGVDTKAVGGNGTQRGHKPPEERRNLFGSGGPFIAAKRGAMPGLPNDFSPVVLFNTHADRLDNLTAAIQTLPLGEPLADYEVTSPFGARNDPINAMTGIHEGVDLGASTGTPVMATGDGQVVWASWRDRYGLVVEIEHGMGLHTRYAHLSKVLVTVGQHISRGAPLGLVGETGRTTGPHLHYEVRMGDQATNPMKFIMAGQNVLKGQ
ncbi:M23 family metallopeptidase [Telmatospirillum sp.]|uniref:M23 family metallopeptidase n=1 Tax=Telmatospirillum sp. TaxID=2079197 RepID=UPI002852C179|nr:M23 family metallopeptidase [Telmatospirillum sp.]